MQHARISSAFKQPWVCRLHQRHTFFFQHSPEHREDLPFNMNHHDTRATGLSNVSNPTLELISKTAQRQLKCKQPKDDIKCPWEQTVSMPCLTLKNCLHEYLWSLIHKFAVHKGTQYPGQSTVVVIYITNSVGGCLVHTEGKEQTHAYKSGALKVHCHD